MLVKILTQILINCVFQIPLHWKSFTNIKASWAQTNFLFTMEGDKGVISEEEQKKSFAGIPEAFFVVC